MENAAPKPDLATIRAQKRLLKAHQRLGSWRKLADELKLSNVAPLYDFAVHGKLPGNPEISEILLRPPKEEKPMNQKMMQLLDLLRFHHVGKDHAIRRRDLLEQLYDMAAAQDESNNNPFDREMREMIQELNHDYGALICPSQNGYFWASSLDELLKSVEPLEKGARTQLINVGHLKANAKRKFGGQLRMDV